MMEQLFQIAAKISGPWSLAAFGIAAVMYIVLKKRGKVTTFGWACILCFVLIPIISAAYVELFRIKAKDSSLYRVRVTVLGLNQIPVEDAKVWSSLGGEPKRVSGGWEFDIPASLTPADKKVTIFAALPSEFLSSESTVTLAADYNPTAVVKLQRSNSSSVRGVVVDASGRNVEGARVNVAGTVAGFETAADGQFTLATDAADGEDVLLRVSKDGYRPVQQLHPAGNEPVTIVLYPEKK